LADAKGKTPEGKSFLEAADSEEVKSLLKGKV